MGEHEDSYLGILGYLVYEFKVRNFTSYNFGKFGKCMKNSYCGSF
jgi:hypothetical protein